MKPPEHERGAALLTVGITSIVLVTTWGGTEYAWTSARIMELIGIGVAALVGFALLILRQPKHRDPTSGDDGARV